MSDGRPPQTVGVRALHFRILYEPLRPLKTCKSYCKNRNRLVGLFVLNEGTNMKRSILSILIALGASQNAFAYCFEKCVSTPLWGLPCIAKTIVCTVIPVADGWKVKMLHDGEMFLRTIESQNVDDINWSSPKAGPILAKYSDIFSEFESCLEGTFGLLGANVCLDNLKKDSVKLL